jgi:hypothetical protein
VAEVADQFGLDPAGLRALVQLHEELDAAWDRHKADERYRNDSYLTIPVIGTDQPTLSSATWDGTKLRTGPGLPAGQEGIPGAGDGTVPQVSAIPLTQSTPKDFRGYFVAEQHASLQNQEFVLNDLVKRIKLLLSPNLAAVRGEVPPSAPGAPLNLELDDIYGADEPVIVRASAPGAGPGDAPALEARVERADDGVAATYPLELSEDGGASRHLVGLKPGLYRVEVGAAGKDAARFLPVHTVFEVAERGGGGSLS